MQVAGTFQWIKAHKPMNRCRYDRTVRLPLYVLYSNVIFVARLNLLRTDVD